MVQLVITFKKNYAKQDFICNSAEYTSPYLKENI